MDENLEQRVARQFAPLYLTLVSVMVGLVLADLIAEVHGRMTLWPLTLETLRTYGQVFSNALAALAAWVTYSHLGMLRRRVPTIWDTVDAMLVLVTIPLNAAAGRHDMTGWFFWGGCYCLLGISAVRINLWQSSREPQLAHFLRLGRFGGPYTFLYLGIPFFFSMAVVSWRHLLTPLAEALVSPAGMIGGVLVSILFMREWRAAVLEAPTPAPAV